MGDTEVISLIQKLRAMRESRGAAPAEADTARRRIGSLLQEHPTLEVVAGNTREYSRTRASGQEYTRKKEDPPFYLGECLCLGATEKAILVEWEGKPIWIPKSQCTSSWGAWKPGDTVEVTVTGWFARQRGWATP